jgi:hypothetical protein
MATPIEATPSVAQEESNKKSEKSTDQHYQHQNHQQNQDPNPFDMRICITGGAGGLFGAAARMAGALAPKSHPPKADIF